MALSSAKRSCTHTLVSPPAPPSYVLTVRTATAMSASEGERTALRQAVRPNGTYTNLTVTLAVMGRPQGFVGGCAKCGAGRDHFSIAAGNQDSTPGSVTQNQAPARTRGKGSLLRKDARAR